MNSPHSFGSARRLTPFILFTAFLGTFSTGLLNPLMPALNERYGGTAFEIGLLFTCHYLARFIASPSLGVLSDRYGRRPILLISLFGSAIGYLVFGIGGALWVLFASWIWVGLIDGSVAAVYAYAADTTEPRDRTRTFAFIGAAMGVGFILGSVVSGVASQENPNLPVYVLAAVLFVAGVWGQFAMRESLPSDRRTPKLKVHQANVIVELQNLFKFEHLRWLMLSFSLTWMTVMVFGTNLPLLISDRLGWNADQIAPLFALYGVIDVCIKAGVLPRLLPRFGEIRIAIAGSVLSGLGCAMLGAFPATGSVELLYAAVVVFTIGQSPVETALFGMISKSVSPRDQGRIQGSVNAVQALAQVMGPLWAGFLYQAVSPAMPYWSGGIQMLMGGLAVFLAIPGLRIAEQQWGIENARD